MRGPPATLVCGCSDFLAGEICHTTCYRPLLRPEPRLRWIATHVPVRQFETYGVQAIYFKLVQPWVQGVFTCLFVHIIARTMLAMARQVALNLVCAHSLTDSHDLTPRASFRVILPPTSLLIYKPDMGSQLTTEISTFLFLMFSQNPRAWHRGSLHAP